MLSRSQIALNNYKNNLQSPEAIIICQLLLQYGIEKYHLDDINAIEVLENDHQTRAQFWNLVNQLTENSYFLCDNSFN